MKHKGFIGSVHNRIARLADKAGGMKRLWVGAAAVAAMAAAGLCVGSGGWGLPEAGAVLWRLRVPRVATALIAGAALAVAGAELQSLFRNPLADPHIMGVSGGAGLGAALATLAAGGLSGAGTGLPGAGVACAAFLGAVAASGLIVAAATRTRSTATLLIFGVLLGFVFSAVTSVLQYTAREESLRLFYSWAAGSFTGTRYGELALMAGALVIGLGMALRDRKGLDIMLFGDAYAELAGAPLRRIRLRTMAGCCLMTGAVTAFCGPVGFVGIVAPHLARRALGTAQHGTVLVGAALAGSLVSLFADGLSQAFPSPVPVGSTMALIGIPAILFILLRRR